MADIIEVPCIILVWMPSFSASIRNVTCVVAINGSPGTRSMVLSVSAAVSICLPFSSSRVCRVIVWIFLLHIFSKFCMLKFGIWLVYVSINTFVAVFISSKPFRVMPYSSFNPNPIKTSSFIANPQGDCF